VGVRFLIAIEWMLTTTLALVLAHLAVEIAGATLLGYALLILLPFIGGAVGGRRSASFSGSSCGGISTTTDRGLGSLCLVLWPRGQEP
jgi:hypothetical protein